MPDNIPFVTSDNNYRLVLPIGDARYLFDTYWNARDLAWYFDLREEDETPILVGVKVVLGVNLGRTSSHSFFKTNILRAFDSSGLALDAGYDDLGSRIQVLHSTIDEFAGVAGSTTAQTG